MRNKLLYSFVISVVIFGNTLGQAIWKQYQGPYSGDFFSFVSTGNVVCAGGTNGGLFRSDDYGKRWQIAAYPNSNVYSFISLDSLLLAYVDVMPRFSASRDSGKHWFSLPGATLKGDLNGYCKFKNMIFGVDDYGVYQFDPSAKTWTNCDTGFHSDVECITSLDTILFCGTLYNGVFCSRDSGHSWQSFTTPMNSHGFTNIINCHDTLYLELGETHNIFCSADTGKTWTNIQENLPFHMIWAEAVFENALYIGTGFGVYKFNTSTSAWSLVDGRVIKAMYANDSLFFTSNPAGTYKWDRNTQKFIVSDYGMNVAKVNDIAIFDNKLYCANYAGTSYTADDGETWHDVVEINNMACNALAQIDSFLFAATSDGIYFTSRGSDVWIRSDSGITKPDTFFFTPKYILDIKLCGNILMAATNTGVYKSLDKGKNWILIPSPMGHDSAEMVKVVSGNGMVLAGNNFGLYKLSGDSTKWELVGFSMEGVGAINIIDGVVYANKQYGQLYKSVDSCKTWIPLGVGVLDIIKRGDNLYAAVYSQIIYSHDEGLTWDYLSETGMPNYNIERIVQSGDCFYAGTYGKSVWKREYLKLTGCSSEKYEITGDAKIKVPTATSYSEFRDNIDPDHGASLMLVKTGSKKSASAYIQAGDSLKIIAEDENTVKEYFLETYFDGIDKPEDIHGSDVRIFPVPVTDKLNISSEISLKAYVITDLNGRIIKTGDIKGKVIETNDLASGLYFIKITGQDNSITTLKFIKQ